MPRICKVRLQFFSSQYCQLLPREWYRVEVASASLTVMRSIRRCIVSLRARLPIAESRSALSANVDGFYINIGPQERPNALTKHEPNHLPATSVLPDLPPARSAAAGTSLASVLQETQEWKTVVHSRSLKHGFLPGIACNDCPGQARGRLRVLES